MWQRLQTLYFGIATLIVASLFWSDAAKAVGPDGTVENISFTGNTIYLIWLVLLIVLQVLSLGGYKWRMRQFRVVIVTGIMCLAFQGWLVYDYVRLHDEVVFSWTALLPVVAGILDFFGARNILLDEAIVQSANRLRLPRNKNNRR